jgi:hypothetical protein
MPASLATVAVLLKEIYEPTMRKQLNDETIALRRIERSSDGIETTVGGRYVTFPIKTRRNSGIGARNELELLPVPGQQGNAAGRVGLKYLYGGVRLSGQTFELADKNYQSFVSVLEQELDGLKTDLAKDQNRQVYGDGSGAIAVVTTAGTTVNTLTVGTVMYAQMDEMVDLIDGATLANATPTVKVSNRKITGINTTTNVITFDGVAASSAVGDVVVRTGNVNREWTGFSKIISNTGILYNLDPSVEPVWKAEVNGNSGTNRALSEGLMIDMCDRIRTNGGKVSAIFSNLGVRRSYWNLLVQQRQYVNTKEFTGGFNGLAFTTDQGEVPFVVDVDAPKNRQYFVNEKELTLYREGDWSWMNRDGSMWQRVSGYDAYEATMYQYSEIGCHRRNTHGVIADITES